MRQQTTNELFRNFVAGAIVIGTVMLLAMIYISVFK
jgi:hypothetical protein